MNYVEILGEEPTNREIAQYLERLVPDLTREIEFLRRKVKDLEKKINETEASG